MEDILIACVDGLTGFDNAIEAVYPKTEIQQCIIHQIRNTTRFVSYKDIKALMAQAERSAGTFSQRVRQALGSRAVAASAITYTPGQIGFKAESTATAVPVFIDIQHQ